MTKFVNCKYASAVSDSAASFGVPETEKALVSLLDQASYTVFPGFCDVHVHFREPGFSYKGTIRTGALAAARGGYTAVCTMPNLSPVPDSPEHLRRSLELIARDACVDVRPYGAVTVAEQGEQLANLEALAPDVVAFSDDGRGIQSESLMRSAMERLAKLGKVLSAHCEDNSLLRGGYIHDGAYAQTWGHRGICSESEWGPIARDLRLAKETGCAYHVCHISCRESVNLIRKAKAEGVNVTCETAPHYLLLDENDLQEEGRFKMNPPLRGEEDRLALLEGLTDGTIDMVATDHAPHSEEEKSRGLEGSPFGIVGLETAFPLLYTYLVRPGVITMDRLLDLLVTAPRRRFGIPLGNDFSVWDLEREYLIDPVEFLSLGKATPFTMWPVRGRCLLTAFQGKPVYIDPELPAPRFE